MLSGLLSFLGGSAFRMLWGEASAFFNKRQDHEHEMALLTLQATIDDRRAEREVKQMQLAHTMGLEVVEVKRDAEVAVLEAKAFSEAMKVLQAPTGVAWVDAWNGTVRPAWATVALLLWVGKLSVAGFHMDPWDVEMVSAVAGFFFADRSLGRRGK